MYEVSYSGYVLDALRDLLARNPGRGMQLAAALRQADHRFRVYPQFGQPMYDLSVGSAQLWVGVVVPLVFHYVLDEEHRRVLIIRPPMPLPHTDIT